MSRAVCHQTICEHPDPVYRGVVPIAGGHSAAGKGCAGAVSAHATEDSFQKAQYHD